MSLVFCRFTCMQAYKNLLNELGDQAGQHELIAENLSSSVVQELSSLTKQLKDDRRKVFSNINKHSLLWCFSKYNCETCPSECFIYFIFFFNETRFKSFLRLWIKTFFKIFNVGLSRPREAVFAGTALSYIENSFFFSL